MSSGYAGAIPARTELAANVAVAINTETLSLDFQRWCYRVEQRVRKKIH